MLLYLTIVYITLWHVMHLLYVISLVYYIYKAMGLDLIYFSKYVSTVCTQYSVN